MAPVEMLSKEPNGAEASSNEALITTADLPDASVPVATDSVLAADMQIDPAPSAGEIPHEPRRVRFGSHAPISSGDFSLTPRTNVPTIKTSQDPLVSCLKSVSPHQATLGASNPATRVDPPRSYEYSDAQMRKILDDFLQWLGWTSAELEVILILLQLPTGRDSGQSRHAEPVTAIHRRPTPLISSIDESVKISMLSGDIGSGPHFPPIGPPPAALDARPINRFESFAYRGPMDQRVSGQPRYRFDVSLMATAVLGQ